MKSIRRKQDQKPTDKQVMDAITQNLQINDFVTYKQLAEMCGLKYYSGGKAKQLQLDDLKRFINYEYDVDQKKYLITEIRKTYLEKPPRKLREDAVYTKYIEILLLSYIKDNPGVSCVMSKKQWWMTLSMVNYDYVKYENKNKRNEILKKKLSTTMDMNNINAFYFRVNKRFTTLFYRSLENLEKRRLINYHKVYLVRYEDEDELHIANDIEESNIIDSEHRALEEIGLKSIQQLYIKPEMFDKYYETISRIQKDLYGIDEAYREIKIVHGKDFIESELRYSKEELKDLAIKCNDAFKENIDNELKTSYKNTRLRLPNYDLDDENDVKDMEIIMKTIGCDIDTVLIGGIEAEHFLENQQILSNELILNHPV